MILTPCRFLGVADKVGARDVVMVADLGPAHPGEELFRAVRIDTARRAVGRTVVDTLHGEVYCCSFISYTSHFAISL